MTGKLGADPVELRRLASAFERNGEGLEDAARTIGSKIRASRWDGPDAARFLSEWDTTHKVSLLMVSRTFGDVAKQLRDQAAQQDRASGEGGGSGGEGAAGGGGGGGGGGSAEDEEREDPNKRPHAFKQDELRDGGWEKTSTHEWGNERVDTNGDGVVDDKDSPELRPFDRTESNEGAPQPDTDPKTWQDRTEFEAEVWKGPEASGFAGAEHADGGEFGSEDGVHGSGDYSLRAGAGYDAEVGAKVTKDGLVAEAKAGANVGVTADAKGEIGYGEHVKAEGEAHASVGASAEASAGVTAGPHGVSATVAADAMLGAEASASGKVDLGGVGAGGSVHGYAGIGAHFEAGASFSADKVGFKVDMGVALGLGGGASVDLSVDPREVVDTIGDLGDGAFDLAGDVGGFLNPFD